MANPGERTDPYLGFQFIVNLVDTSSTVASAQTSISAVPSAGFSECSGLDGTLLVEDYSAGGENGFVHKFPTRMTYSNIVLKRGVSSSDDLWNWHFDYVIGRGKRRDGVITLQDELRNPIKRWIFRRGMPLKWTGPTLNAGQGAVAIETLEIVHEGLELL